MSSLETSETLVSDSDQKSEISDKTSEKTRKKLWEERRNFGEKRKLASKNKEDF